MGNSQVLKWIYVCMMSYLAENVLKGIYPVICSKVSLGIH